MGHFAPLDQQTLEPFLTFASLVTTWSEPSKLTAESIIPLEAMCLMTLGAKLATKRTYLPTSTCGSG